MFIHLEAGGRLATASKSAIIHYNSFIGRNQYNIFQCVNIFKCLKQKASITLVLWVSAFRYISPLQWFLITSNLNCNKWMELINQVDRLWFISFRNNKHGKVLIKAVLSDSFGLFGVWPTKINQSGLCFLRRGRGFVPTTRTLSLGGAGALMPKPSAAPERVARSITASGANQTGLERQQGRLRLAAPRAAAQINQSAAVWR